MAPFANDNESNSTRGVIDLTADDGMISHIDSEDEDLRQAIILSLQCSQASSATASPKKTVETLPPPAANGLLGISRAQMEQERLSRLKRKRGAQGSVSPPPLIRRLRASSSGSANGPASTTSSTAAATTPNLQNLSLPAVVQPPSSTPAPLSALRFPKPTTKQTWCFGFSHTSSTIKLEELLDRSNLQSAVLSSFIWDFDWLFPKLDTKRTKFLLVMQGKDPRQRQQLQSDFEGISNVRLCFPPMDGQVHCMHSKLMLLFFQSHLRIVVPSANLVPFDWGEDGVMENTIFVIDLPKLDTSNTPTETSPFYTSLLAFLRAQTLPTEIIHKLSSFDFTPTSNIGFVHTIGGSHTGSAWRQTGHPGLGRTISSLGLQTAQPIRADFVTSSVGSLNAEFIRSIYLAAQGDDGLTELTLRTAKKFPAPTAFAGGKENDKDNKRMVTRDRGSDWQSNFHFYFPTESTVNTSKGGPAKAGTICFSEKWWDSPKFPRDNMRDCVSVRERLLMHNKILFARYPEPIRSRTGTEETTSYSGWAYVGSANLSESAWGRLVYDKATQGPKLNCRNWECGVVIPVPTSARNNAAQANEHSRCTPAADDMRIFEGVVPVPMMCPGAPYAEQRPWFFGVS